MEEWQDCEELEPKPKKLVFLDKTWKRGAVRGHMQVPLHEMREKHREDEDARAV